MRIGVLGTGMVGAALATKLVGLGHDVKMGSRAAGNEKAVAWAAETGGSEGSFADAAVHGELLLNCTGGAVAPAVLDAAGAENLAGKVVIDVSNPLDFSQGFPPTLTVCNTDSVGEQLQRAFPEARIVKALNTVNARVMVDPRRVPGDHVLFVCGDDADAKTAVVALLGEMGWPAERVIDLGGIEASRGTEMYLPLWLRLMGGPIGGPDFNLVVAR